MCMGNVTCWTKNLHQQLSSLNPSKTAWRNLKQAEVKVKNDSNWIHNAWKINQKRITITINGKRTERPKEKTILLVSASIQTRHDCRSTEYLPDIKSGVTLGLISGWKPPNAWMARKFLKTGARLAVLAQRAGCTAFNPWHDGLPCSVWKHQLWFSNLDLLWRSIQPGWRSTRRTDTHWWEFYMVVWCSSR